MKRIIQSILAALLVVTLAGCGSTSPNASSEGLKITAEILPEYDWVMNILGDNPAGAEVTLLMNSGTDLHSYQPTAGDILKIADCDLFLCVGGESDRWAEDALRESANPDRTVIRLLEVSGSQPLEEELPEGAEGEAEEGVYDEHIWLSLRRSEILVQAIGDAIAAKDPAHAALYQENTAAYIEQLRKLDDAYAQAVRSADRTVLVFGDRFPFRYLAEDYGLTCYAAFPGCSAESEAGFATVLNLAAKLDEYGLRHVMKIEGSDDRLARTIIENSKDRTRDILTLNSMQGGKRGDFSYLAVMEENLKVLKQALNEGREDR